MRLGWTISYKSLSFVHPSLQSLPVFTGMRERYIACTRYPEFEQPVRARQKHYPLFQYILNIISIYTPSDLGDLSNLIGSLSRTIQARFFSHFLSEKVDKILGLTFFQARKDFEGFKTAFFHLLLLSFVVNGLFTTPVYLPRRGRFVNSAFPDKKNLAQKRSLFMTNKFESKCLQKFQVSSKHEREQRV